MKLLTLLAVPLAATLVQGQGGNPPHLQGGGGGGGGGGGAQPTCSNCSTQKVCDSCVTTEVPHTSIIPAQTHSWTQTEVNCQAVPTTSTCSTPLP
ncbi:uncharacterized protein N7469_009058 [Penicillium citrinum]|uniref:Uncharacterized protein n=2 Tax=Penicillium TaxID=5073 RepID=A0A9W9NQ75_PENCI|nr:uncharacterized protein N7469_009058 [Penicillium citrinum]KAJ5222818.1 hypothetical protein N7469_009058 [Penicillium citrinum]KAJ5580979.1 hypothetical protein N7450_007280 [Penicillium hetheringtonii]